MDRFKPILYIDFTYLHYTMIPPMYFSYYFIILFYHIIYPVSLRFTPPLTSFNLFLQEKAPPPALTRSPLPFPRGVNTII